MTAAICHGIRMDESLDIVLEMLMREGEIIESMCYDKGVGTRRISRTLAGLSELGMVESYIRSDGQKVPVYSLSRKGKALADANSLMHDLLGFHGDLNMDDDALDGFLRSMESCRSLILECRKKNRAKKCRKGSKGPRCEEF